jgi:hypothetical protein
MNYSSLKTAIQSYVENEFSSTDIDVFITQAEQRIYNTVQILRQGLIKGFRSIMRFLMTQL